MNSSGDKQAYLDSLREIPESGDKNAYLEVAKHSPQLKENSFLSTLSDYAKTALKGTAEGLGRLGKAFGPLHSFEGLTPQQEFEQQTENLNQLLPTEDDFGQRAVRRGLQQAPTALASPWSTLATLPRAIAAGFLGEGAKDLGAPEWAQTAAELTAYIGPDVTKKLLSSGKNKDIIDFGKKMGMTNEQITPLIQSEFKQKWLSKLSPKRGSTEQALKNTKGALQESYQSIQKSEIATKELSELDNGKLINGLKEFLNEMPNDVKDKIGKDVNDLLSNKITGRSLMNFWSDINHHFNEKQLGTLKGPVKKAIDSISPEMGKDFEMINKMYTKYYPIASKLKPNITSDIIQAGEVLGAGYGVFSGLFLGNYGPLTGVVTEAAARKISQQMLINPHFQQISKKMVKALNENKFMIVKRLSDSMAEQIRKTSPEATDELKKLDQADFERMISSRE